ncbi:exonuclease SbcCD subunit D [Treponema sp. Marseille-Q3903]|uniref:exonuclease SbcCD subunit D n=1 Tax=Treponema sp. Marseille-Q3903 TaxID=2766703 RepID=UPI0016524DE2|nr:exonuclease SbcCD subunit D [Treponema sp. Marseille-Q3903]MBC6713339.1 exonuclease SbcCD subunit D [Treponema sp. Marseille-Q3903]
MKIAHISDLHLGKRLNEFSLLEDQRYILNEIIKIIDDSQVDCVIIAGDVYDKSIPPVEAVEIFDNFLTCLARRKLHVLIISGNHDSAERMTFGAKLMSASGIHFAPVYKGKTEQVILEDKYGKINFYLLPFVKPSVVRPFFPEEKIETYTDAIRLIVKNMNVDKSQRNVIVAHQFVTGAERCESEEICVGGSENVDASVFDDFDYVALGHIHGSQKILKETVRYCGSPLKYSFSECDHKKSIPIVEINEKSNVKIDFAPLVPKLDLREIRGKYDEIMLKKNYENTNTEDYLHITLTDEYDIPEGFARLSSVFKNLMKLDYDNKRTKSVGEIDSDFENETLSPLELFQKFYNLQNNQHVNDEQNQILTSLISEIWGGSK